MYQFKEEHLEAFLDACISYESQGKKVSECQLQFDFTFLNNSLDKEWSCGSREVESEENAAKEGKKIRQKYDRKCAAIRKEGAAGRRMGRKDRGTPSAVYIFSSR